MSINIESLEQIDAQLAELQAKKLSILNTQRAAKLDEVKAIVRQFGFTAKELGLGGAAEKPAKASNAPVNPAKYANPANPQQQWAGGKGARPLWVKAHLNNGGKLEDLEIKKN